MKLDLGPSLQLAQFQALSAEGGREALREERILFPHSVCSLGGLFQSMRLLQCPAPVGSCSQEHQWPAVSSGTPLGDFVVECLQ